MKAKLAFLSYLIVIMALAIVINHDKPVQVSALQRQQSEGHVDLKVEQSITEKFLNTKTEDNGLSWTDYHTIAHALGSIENKRATNSLEAMAVNYEVNNMRIFETDLILTSDRKLVARHDWLAYLYKLLGEYSLKGKKSVPLTYNEFIHLKPHNKFEPMDFEMLANILKNHKDIYVITDTKLTKPEDIKEQFNIIVDTATKVDPKILDRLIIQVYNEAMYKEVTSIYPFKNIIYAVYMNNDSEDKVTQFSQKNHIQVVAIPTNRVTPQFVAKLAKYNIKTIVHSVNTEEDQTVYKAMGAWAVYSDYLIGL
ncbi:MAG TPA: phosphatidylinositol-specific phospholipase C/glycerophosphodiester phosphodiesterase family protein [Desulfobacteria bacterium]|nr:phosphatidylinositol-specific phospholipase C/glycerophosphodiester phosphodiesterase family protein [Desulfobacteria bacterium]